MIIDYRKIIKRRLKELDMSPIQAAEKININRLAIKSIVEGTKPSIDRFLEIADKLDISVVFDLPHDFSEHEINPDLLSKLMIRVTDQYSANHKIPTSEMVSKLVAFLYKIISDDGVADCPKISIIIESVINADDSGGFYSQFKEFSETLKPTTPSNK
ncbi:MAG: helix-turn-helix transcriptional regulator [Alphaproteobacteria bacterium]|nr:helix-turn-helix transcriptional regulator [Alphaproteobacteria bacterium]